MNSKSNFITQILSPLLIFLIFITLILTLTHPAISFTQDLGRHLKLGQIILSTKSVPQTNLLTYTNTNYEFINHHWLSEVIFHLLHQNFGINFLIVLKIILLTTSFSIAFYLTQKKSSPPLAALLSLIFLPIFLERTHIRPEIFSFLLFSAVLFILSLPKPSLLSLSIIPLILLLWVNLHIYFAAGLALLIFYLLNKAIHKQFTKTHLFILLVSFSLLLINPNGIKTIILPLNILKSYGYTIVENQNPFFLLKILPRPSFWPFFISLTITTYAIFKSLKAKNYFHFLTLLFFTLLALKQIRNFPLYALACLPLSSIYLYSKVKNLKFNLFNLALPIGIIIQGFSLSKVPTPKLNEPFNIHQPFKFILNHKLKPPIFNNFDIAGLAAYHLYPQYQLFVDNRPEAFPAEFFQNTYIPMQQNPQIFSQIDSLYNFNTIIFAHTDITPWGLAFLRTITQNPNWTIVYLDDYAVILTRLKSNNNDNNALQTITDQNALQKLQPLLSINNTNTLFRLHNFFATVNWKNSKQFTLQRLNYLLK